jgi:hypothetical protein
MASPIQALGKVTATSGTPVRITNNQTSPSARKACHAIMIEALPSNTGKVYVMDRSTGIIATFVGVIAVLAIPTSNFIPVFTVGFSGGVNPINAADFYIDVETTGEGAIISVLEL